MVAMLPLLMNNRRHVPLAKADEVTRLLGVVASQLLAGAQRRLQIEVRVVAAAAVLLQSVMVPPIML